MTFDLIVAMDEQNGIGKAGDLPWELPADLRHFREVTVRTKRTDSKNAVVMGRRTWQSIPAKFRPLPDRVNVVLSRDAQFSIPVGGLVARSLEEVSGILDKGPFSIETVFVIGGQQIYEAALAEGGCRRIYITRVRGDFGCDAFFPTLPSHFSEISAGSLQSQNGIDFSFHVYEAALPTPSGD